MDVVIFLSDCRRSAIASAQAICNSDMRFRISYSILKPSERAISDCARTLDLLVGMYTLTIGIIISLPFVDKPMSVRGLNGMYCMPTPTMGRSKEVAISDRAVAASDSDTNFLTEGCILKSGAIRG